IEGLSAIVDLNAQRVMKIEDTGAVPIPPESGNYAARYLAEVRQDLKPIEITQPDGPSFVVNGHHVRWQKWDFRIGWTPREGLVLHTVGYEDGGRVRQILYRASLSEMVVPYGDPSSGHYRKNAFDVGEFGVGILANSLTLGCDCLGEIRYFDAVMADAWGVPYTLQNAICLHEEDFGILWKHTDWRTGEAEVRRSRRLVVSFITTVGNYEYGFFWYFYQDGGIQLEVKLTGILATGALRPGETSPYGAMIAPQLYAPSHQHFFNVRLDMSVEGDANTVYEVNTKAVPPGPENPHGNAFRHHSTPLRTESEAQRLVDPSSARYWKIANPAVKNRLGESVAYKLVPGEAVLPFAQPTASFMERAGFLTKHLWVTPFHPDELYASGNYPNQHRGGDGLPRWTMGNRSVEDTDLVVWYTFGHHHIPRPEDWPVMPCAYTGFHLKPVGFFDRNPGLDVPVSPPHTAGDCCPSGDQ
ncbi:MAG: primary-amine oxidase, partial [Cytophagales bacterium]|nr:primary-amine oxidase [Armatimonadota bacterium]